MRKKEKCQYCSTSRANQALRSLANAGFQNRGVCLQAFPSFPSPSPLFHFLALVSFLARSKPKVPFLGISLLRNQTETLDTQASLRAVLCYKRLVVEHQNSANSLKTLQNGLRRGQTTKNTTRQQGASILFKNITFFLSFKKSRLQPIQAFVNNRKTSQNSDSRSVRRSRRIIPLENYPRPQFLQKFKAEMLQFHVHSLDSQFLPQIVH